MGLDFKGQFHGFAHVQALSLAADLILRFHTEPDDVH